MNKIKKELKSKENSDNQNNFEDKIDILQEFIDIITKDGQLNQFITDTLEYPLTKEEEPLVNVRGNAYIIFLYLYIKNLKYNQNSLIIYQFINDYFNKQLFPNQEQDIQYQNIFIKDCLILERCKTKLSQFAHYLNKPNLNVDDLLEVTF